MIYLFVSLNVTLCVQHNLKRISTPASPFCYVCVFDLCPVFGKVGHLWKYSRQNKTFYGVSCSIFLCFMGVLFPSVSLLSGAISMGVCFLYLFFFNVYTWSSPIKILLILKYFCGILILWSLSFIRDMLFMSLCSESPFCIFLEKKI